VASSRIARRTRRLNRLRKWREAWRLACGGGGVYQTGSSSAAVAAARCATCRKQQTNGVNVVLAGMVCADDRFSSARRRGRRSAGDHQIVDGDAWLAASPHRHLDCGMARKIFCGAGSRMAVPLAHIVGASA